MRRIAYLTDIHLGEQYTIDNNVDAERNWKCILDDVKKEKIMDIVFGGDIGEMTSHDLFFDSLKSFSFKITLGNHDQSKEVAKHFPLSSTDQSELYYKDEDDFFKYLFLDSSSDCLSVNQVEWMKRELETEKKVVLFIHHPILEIDTTVDSMYPLQNRTAVKNCLMSSGKEITVFCGHYHLDDERTIGKLRQIVTPASSFQIVKSADEFVVDATEFGYRIIEFKAGKIETEIKMFKNEILA